MTFSPGRKPRGWRNVLSAQSAAAARRRRSHFEAEVVRQRSSLFPPGREQRPRSCIADEGKAIESGASVAELVKDKSCSESIDCVRTQTERNPLRHRSRIPVHVQNGSLERGLRTIDIEPRDRSGPLFEIVGPKRCRRSKNFSTRWPLRTRRLSVIAATAVPALRRRRRGQGRHRQLRKLGNSMGCMGVQYIHHERLLHRASVVRCAVRQRSHLARDRLCASSGGCGRGRGGGADALPAGGGRRGISCVRQSTIGTSSPAGRGRLPFAMQRAGWLPFCHRSVDCNRPIAC